MSEEKKVFKDHLRDSVGKVIERYFHTVTAEPFSYRGKVFYPRDIRVSPDLMRDFDCKVNCGACCYNWTLDYLPSETHPYQLEKRMIEFNGQEIEIWTDYNHDGKTFCKNLNTEDGRCKIHTHNPFSCDFEVIRTFQPAHDSMDRTRLSQQLFGRGWAMKRIDGERGALCELHGRSEKSRQNSIRKLKLLMNWSDHFKIKTVLPQVIAWLEAVPLDTKEALYIQNNYEKNSQVLDF